MQIDKNIAAVVTGGAVRFRRRATYEPCKGWRRVAIFDLNEEPAETGEGRRWRLCKVDGLSEEKLRAGFEKARAAPGQERIWRGTRGGCKGRADRQQEQ